MERLSKAGIRLDSYLNELQQISNLESLRPYLIKEGCFLQKYNENQVNIIIPTIGFEELKRLVRLWKLDHGTVLLFQVV